MKTLAVYHKQLGDTLLLQPALARLAAQDGEPVGLVMRPGFADLVRLMPGVAPIGWREAPRVARLLCYDAGDRSVFVSLWCASRLKTLLTFSSHYQKFYHSWIFQQFRLQEQEQKYRARYFWDITPGAETDIFQPPVLTPPPASWRHAGLPAKSFILVHPTSAWKRKCWPTRPWQEVISYLKSETGMPVVLTGGNSDWERELCGEIAQGCSDIVNLGGKTSLREMIYTVSQAAMVLCVDGFVSHLAMAFRRRCITLFGPTNVNHWHLTTPHSEAVFAGCDGKGNRHLANVTSLEMIERINPWLGLLAASGGEGRNFEC
jgi:ADP-heptose:LPS heptosyltransferase